MRKLAAGSVAGIGLLGSAVFAQSSKLDPPDLSRYLRWGPVRIRPAVELKNFGYDDNILFSQTNPISDVTATIAPRAQALVLFGHRAFVTYDGELAYTGYAQNSGLNYLNQYHSGRFTLPFSRFGLYVDGAYYDELERPTDLEGVRIQHTERRFGFGGILELGWRTEIELGTLGSRFDYDDPDAAANPGAPTTAQRLDRETRGTELHASYRVRGRTRITLDSDQRRLDFRSPLTFGGELVDRDGDAWRLLPGLNFGEGGRLLGNLRLGWGVVDARDRRLPDLSEPVGDADLQYRPSGRDTLRLELRRQPDFAVYENDPYFVQSSARLSHVHYFNRILGAEGALGGGRLVFPGSEVATERIDTYLRYELGVRLRLSENSLGRRVEYALRYTHYERESTIPTLDSTQNSIGVAAILGY